MNRRYLLKRYSIYGLLLMSIWLSYGCTDGLPNGQAEPVMEHDNTTISIQTISLEAVALMSSMDEASAAIQPEAIVLQTLEDRYSAIGARVQILQYEPGILEVLVDQMSGEVLKGGKLWEQLEIVVMITSSAEEIELHLFVDGRVASGLKAPTNLEDYKDVAPGHSDELRIYLRQLLTEMRGRIIDEVRTLVTSTNYDETTQVPITVTAPITTGEVISSALNVTDTVSDSAITP